MLGGRDFNHLLGRVTLGGGIGVIFKKQRYVIYEQLHTNCTTVQPLRMGHYLYQKYGGKMFMGIFYICFDSVFTSPQLLFALFALIFGVSFF